MATTQECSKLYCISLQNSSGTANYYPSPKTKLDELDMQDTAGEVGTNSSMIYSCRPPHMDKHMQDNQLESTYKSSVLIQDVALKTYHERWTIEKGGGRGSGRSVLMAGHDDDDGFYGIPTIVGYLMPNPLYTYILIYMTWFGFMLYQPLLVI